MFQLFLIYQAMRRIKFQFSLYTYFYFLFHFLLIFSSAAATQTWICCPRRMCANTMWRRQMHLPKSASMWPMSWDRSASWKLGKRALMIARKFNKFNYLTLVIHCLRARRDMENNNEDHHDDHDEPHSRRKVCMYVCKYWLNIKFIKG